ncbi:hypothetical protein [Ruminiclostridium josui]|uniref:hypothetical protein n=1 Tax=Ruminiclostridium josui TaxID=1499 RepID=UPI000463755A|nr:hypothetical protein [Ruminiclostridium josui]
MICPLCKAEYEKGYTKCSDCHIDLVERADIPRYVNSLSQKGLSMLKFGIALLFVTMFELMTLITLHDSNIMHTTYGEGLSGLLCYINPIIKLFLGVQFIISLLVLIYGFCSKERN